MNPSTYKNLVLQCRNLLCEGYHENEVYSSLHRTSGWDVDSIQYAIDEAKEMLKK